jgi:hypothetical protein
MRRFEVCKTSAGYAVRELHEGFSAAPRKPLPTVNYTAQELLEFMFADGAGSKFISGRAAE